jgi:hypothetical protein
MAFKIMARTITIEFTIPDMAMAFRDVIFDCGDCDQNCDHHWL